MEDIELEQGVAVLADLVDRDRLAVEHVSLFDAVGRVAAEDLVARMNNPPFNRSPLDGYTFAASATEGAAGGHPVRLPIVGEECAGDFYGERVAEGDAVRIMTGGAIPAGCDCVVRQEDIRVEEGKVVLDFPLRPFENFCYQGEDVKKGTRLIEKGRRLSAAYVAVLAGQGYGEVPVYRRPRVVFASTGDELLQPGEPLRPGKIYNSNLYLVAGRLKELGISADIIGSLPDDVEKAAAVLKERAAGADLVLTTGGVSVGKKDIMHGVVPAMGGERIFWGLMMKPGSPAIGYRLKDMGTIGIALSGNPFAAYATFELLARPILRRLEGERETELPRRKAVLADVFPKASRGRRFIRARYEAGKAYLPQQHDSGNLFSAAGCNAFLDIPAGTGKLAPGDEVTAVIYGQEE